MAGREVVDDGHAVARATSPSTRFEPMKPAPPVTTQSIAAPEVIRDREGVAGPAPHDARYGPHRRTTLVGLGAVRGPRERGRCSRTARTSLS